MSAGFKTVHQATIFLSCLENLIASGLKNKFLKLTSIIIYNADQLCTVYVANNVTNQHNTSNIHTISPK